MEAHRAKHSFTQYGWFRLEIAHEDRAPQFYSLFERTSLWKSFIYIQSEIQRLIET